MDYFCYLLRLQIAAADVPITLPEVSLDKLR
jgi:hypothetical protein